MRRPRHRLVDRSSVRAVLQRASTQRTLLSIERAACERGRELAYVEEVGRSSFAIARVADTMWLDGWSVLRVADVSWVAPHEHRAFVERALSLRRQRRHRCPRLALGSWADVLRSIGERFPLVTLHHERIDPHVCVIGRVLGVSPRSVRLRGIDPDAQWDAESETVSLTGLTRVDVGGDYEDALRRVAAPM